MLRWYHSSGGKLTEGNLNYSSFFQSSLQVPVQQRRNRSDGTWISADGISCSVLSSHIDQEKKKKNAAENKNPVMMPHILGGIKVTSQECPDAAEGRGTLCAAQLVWSESCGPRIELHRPGGSLKSPASSCMTYFIPLCKRLSVHVCSHRALYIFGWVTALTRAADEPLCGFYPISWTFTASDVYSAEFSFLPPRCRCDTVITRDLMQPAVASKTRRPPWPAPHIQPEFNFCFSAETAAERLQSPCCADQSSIDLLLLLLLLQRIAVCAVICVYFLCLIWLVQHFAKCDHDAAQIFFFFSNPTFLLLSNKFKVRST